MNSKTLGIVLKTVERCNLNCTYCYFFNSIDDSFKKHPAYISFDTIKHIVEFLRKGIQELKIEHVKIGIHGGEPLLQNKKDFDRMCSYFIDNIGDVAKVSFTLQTNAMLLNEKWIDLIEKYRIGVGASIDGPKEYNDKYRIDHSGIGSYDKVVEKIKFFNAQARMRKINTLGCLSVINPEFSGRLAYRHLVDDVHLDSFNFLLPDNNYHILPRFEVSKYGKFMCEVLDEWLKDDNSNINVTFISSSLGMFFDKPSMVYGIGPSDPDELPLITIASNGDLSPVDELRSTDPTMMNLCNVTDCSLKDFLNLPIFTEIKDAQRDLPQKCKECCWEKICGGRWYS